MKNLNDVLNAVQTQHELLKVQRDGLRYVLENPAVSSRLTPDAVYQFEQELLGMNHQLGTLSWFMSLAAA